MLNVMRTIGALVLVLLVGLAPGVGQSPPWRGTVRTVKGVTIVENPKEPLYPSSVFRSAEEYQIPGSGPGYVLDKPCQLALDRDNNLYVVEQREGRIEIFDPNGHLVRTIGRRGAGPGEFEGSIRLDIREDLLVYCSQHMRLTSFSLRGRFVETRSAMVRFSGMSRDSQGNIYGTDSSRDSAGQIHYQVCRYDAKLENRRALAPPVKQPPLGWYGIASPIFIVTRSDRIVYGFPESYEFLLFDREGALIMKVRKNHEPVPIPQEDREYVLKRGSNVFPSEVPRYFPPYAGIEADEDGRIFVKIAGTLSHLMTYDVFDPEGKFLTTIKLKTIDSPLWANGRLYTIEEDEEGYRFIRVSRVSWDY